MSKRVRISPPETNGLNRMIVRGIARRRERPQQRAYKCLGERGRLDEIDGGQLMEMGWMTGSPAPGRCSSSIHTFACAT